MEKEKKETKQFDYNILLMVCVKKYELPEGLKLFLYILLVLLLFIKIREIRIA